ncbi:MAG: WGR domain-containing protein [Butyrivibrio sp.]|uniref:WGR domain-containing protein n=1 Tax=Butyrivibrio sp. TaxID=28121 RepID=UPI001B40A3B6|nr:WGR domain-containing protein [Butyrivibrio sp.]MBP3783843.1 WGR domain-containing protein [Butyrivibrio sp.]
MVEEKYLIMVDPCDNHNKFYRMIPLPNGKFRAEWGRVGANAQSREYDQKFFYDKYQEKIRKGYTDQTDLHTSAKTILTAQSKYRDIDDNEIRILVDKMLAWADQVIKKNYTVSADEVNQDAIDKAQSILNAMTTVSSLPQFNRYLNELFLIIPRQMKDVNEMTAKSSSEFSEIITREQALLDTMAGKVGKTHPDIKSVKAGNTQGMTILEANGLSIRQCDQKEKDEVRSHLDPETAGRFLNCWHVENEATRKRFDAYCKKYKIGKRGIKFYYHGSRNANYWNIFKQGLMIRPTQKVTRAGAMFGSGLYFAPKAKKSVGYTDSGFWAARTGSATYSNKTVLLTVFKVAMGKQMDISAANSSLTETKVRSMGYDSVFAHAGTQLRNDECIVYNDDACTICYIIELKN